MENKQVTAEDLKKEISDYLGDTTYNCTRVWSAWEYGTMSRDDFKLAQDDDDFMDSLVGIFEKFLSQARQESRREGRLEGLREMDEALCDMEKWFYEYEDNKSKESYIKRDLAIDCVEKLRQEYKK